MSEMMNAILQVELRSDLCAGSGYSYAGVIDSDICYDEYGIPYIPAKRIRGCLRETLEGSLYSMYPEKAEDLFGKAGSESASCFIVGNARIKGYDDLVKELNIFRARKNGTQYYGTQEILGRFTHVIGQTAIQENGTADDNTLRYTRVVNRISPLSKKAEALVFEASVTFPVKYKAMLNDAVRATRHIGLKRNRGFGNVKCTLSDIKPAGECVQERKADLKSENTSSDRKLIRVRVRNVDPLVLSARREDESITYISGQSLLGLLAGRYLAEKGKHSAEGKEFFDLFLNGETIFSNLYPADDERIYYPAPVYINRLKITGAYVNVLKAKLPEELEVEKEEYKIKPGNQPKKLKGKYVSFGNGKIAVHEVERDEVYHHSHSKKNADGEEGILYGMEVIRPNQVFEGFIETSNDQYVAELERLLNQGDLYFGKSRSSQYGRCVLETPPKRNDDGTAAKSGKPEQHSASRTLKPGRHLVVTFLSDAIFMTERGEYTVYRDEVEAIVADELGITGKIEAKQSQDKRASDQEKLPGEETSDQKESPVYLSNILTTLATGYRGVWNLRKEAVPAIQAGSCIVYPITEECEIAKQFIGERNLEGYGQIRLDIAKEMPYDGLTEIKAEESAGHGEDNNPDKVSPEMRNLLEKLLVDRWMDELVGDYLRTGNGRIQISNTALGRITLMLRESLESGSRGDYKGQFRDLCKRIQSIKSTAVSKEGRKILSLVASREGDEWKLDLARKADGSGGKSTVEPDTADRIREIRDELIALETSCNSSNGGIDVESRMDRMINERWGEYLTLILTEQKYMGGDQ